jgi:hypothetical protein
MNKPNKDPKLVDHKNMVVYYDRDDLSGLAEIGEVCRYWGSIEPYFAVAFYEGDDSKQKQIVEKSNIKYADEKNKDDKIVDLEARLNKLEKK